MDKSLNLGSTLIFLLISLPLIGIIFWPYSPYSQDYDLLYLAPNADHWFGADDTGRDLVARVSIAVEISFLVGVLSVIIGILIGIPLGCYSAFYGGTADLLVQRVVDILMAFPLLIMGLLIIAAVGSGFTPLVIAIGIAQSPRFARMARACTLSVKENEFIEAAFSFGGGKIYIIYKHVLRNITGPLIIQSVLFISEAIMVEAGLSFLGLGIQPPTPTLGNIIRGGVSFLGFSPWICIIPGAILSLIVIGLNLMGDGLRDKLAPDFI